MKRLLLLRHAKAAAKDAERDFERVLAPRGRSDMERLARVLADPKLRPDLALVSPAARTRETWDRTGLADVPVQWEKAIYEAEPDMLLTLIQGAPEGANSLMLVGHNPGIEMAAALLADASGEPKHPELRAGLPTAALAVFDVDVGSWLEVAFGSGRLVYSATPASLGR